MIRGHIFYDAIYTRERIIEEEQLGRDHEALDNLYLYKDQIHYEFNLRTKQCRKQPLERPWRNYSIPLNATNHGEVYIGSSGIPQANVLTTLWSANFTDERKNVIEYHGST